MSELQPQFTVTVILDGDEWPPTATENAKGALQDALEQMQTDGLIIGYHLLQMPDIG